MLSVLAVDGGQSGIRLAHSADPRVIEVAGASRAGDTVAVVAEAIRSAWTSTDYPAVERVVLGLTTAPADAAGSERLCRLVAGTTGAREVWLADDTVTSHCGALEGGTGISLIAGTGVACLAVPASGAPRLFDGHGYLLGDDGGAFWIGRRALKAVLRARDRGESTLLGERATERYGDLAHVHVRVHDSATPVNDIAQFAREVLAASSEDALAASIVDAAAQRLRETARDAARSLADEHALSLSPAPGIPLALGGRLLDPASPLRARLDELLAETAQVETDLPHPVLAPRSAAHDPLEGALLLGAADSPGRYGDLVYLWNERTRS